MTFTQSSASSIRRIGQDWEYALVLIALHTGFGGSSTLSSDSAAG